MTVDEDPPGWQGRHAAAELIRRVMADEGVTNRELGERLGVTPQTAEKLARGQSAFTVDRLAEVMIALNRNVVFSAVPLLTPAQYAAAARIDTYDALDVIAQLRAIQNGSAPNGH